MESKTLLNESELNSIIKNLSKDIAASVTAKTVFIGIDLRGKILAQRLKKHCQNITSNIIELGTIDTSLYRNVANENYVNIGETNIPFSLKNKHVILVVECLKSGESIYAALNALSDYNEPASIEIAALVNTEKLVYPFLVKFKGKSISTDDNKDIEINFFEINGIDAVQEKLVSQISI